MVAVAAGATLLLVVAVVAAVVVVGVVAAAVVVVAGAVVAVVVVAGAAGGAVAIHGGGEEGEGEAETMGLGFASRWLLWEIGRGEKPSEIGICGRGRSLYICLRASLRLQLTIPNHL